MLKELKEIWGSRFGEEWRQKKGELLKFDNKIVFIEGLSLSALGLLAATLSAEESSPLLIITADEEGAEEVYDSLRYFADEEISFHFSRWATLPFDEDEPPLEVRAKQLETLSALLSYNRRKSTRVPLIASSIEALTRKIFSPAFLSELIFPIFRGNSINVEELIRRLIKGGYERMEIVESRGEFAIRGGIIDIYPPNLERPIRLDLFGNEVESLRYFDVYSQRSLREKGEIEEITILPAREKLLIEEALRRGKLISFFDWLPANTIIIIGGEEKFEELLNDYWREIERRYGEALAKQALLAGELPETFFLRFNELERELRRFLHLIHSPLAVEEAKAKNQINFKGRSFEGMPAAIDSYLNYIKERQREGFSINIACDNEGQAWRLEEILWEHGIPAIAEPPHPQKKNDPYYQELRNDDLRKYVTLTISDLHSGFVLPSVGLIFLTDREIFGRFKKHHIFRRFYKGIPVVSGDEIKRGDFVVHVDHGIGKFVGIRRQSIDGKRIDLLEIEYQGSDKLLVPVDKIHYVQKYSGVEGLIPPLDKLGSKRWLLRKRKSQEAIEKMAKELLELYARRSIAEGYVYSPDSVWQTEFEATFPYEETPDQMQSIQEVKGDLQSPKPADRLVCGDVGYGKTEVAIRAAFKVVLEKKQVALLAPTTILVQQHLRTFRERFTGFPVKIDMLSRFRTPKEQREILHRLKFGDIDIIIGTHRLLSDDVEFCDLGLVIVDEEQRFGVRHKEKLKKMRASVDFITLTATPIPRTLYMALSGLRDISIINTPPPGRLPIKTKVIHFAPELIEEAVVRELNRRGQVFFVHNRIHNIFQVAERLQRIIPRARIAIAHGRMKERELEKVMIDFVEGKYDVLLSTTIIENGLDIPNVNTIIINRADAFGLAQLYQLRGRVGRDIRQAYAYLLVPKGEPITDSAVKRLAAIEEFTELGSGFNVAMRDLEIRGAGNLLGKEQHGCIVNIGFDLYCQLLEQTIRRLKGEEVEEMERPVEIRLRLDAFLPSDYIPVESLRIGIYKRLAQARFLDVIDELENELRDRYGRMPSAVKNLLLISRLRLLCQQLGIKGIIQNKRDFIISIFYGADELEQSLRQIMASSQALLKLKRVGENRFELRVNDRKILTEESILRIYYLLQDTANRIKSNLKSSNSKDFFRLSNTIL